MDECSFIWNIVERNIPKRFEKLSILLLACDKILMYLSI